MGGCGFYKGVGDNLKMKVTTEKFSKEWKAYYEARGEAEQTGNFDLRILKTYGSLANRIDLEFKKKTQL